MESGEGGDGEERASLASVRLRMSGVLLKQSDYLKKWRSRFFKLNSEDGLLLYWLVDKYAPSVRPRGMLPLAGCNVRPYDDDPTVPSAYAFVITHAWMKPWVLAAKSYAERVHWMNALQEVAAVVSEASTASAARPSLPAPDSPPTPRTRSSASSSVRRRPLSRAEDLRESMQDGHGDDDNGDSESPPLSPLSRPQDPEALAPAGLEDKLEDAMNLLLQVGDSDKDWILSFEEHSVQAFRMVNKYTTLKGLGTVPHHPITFLVGILDPSIGTFYDPQLMFAKRCGLVNKHCYIDYLRYKGIFPVAPRDMYTVSHWRILSPGVILIVVFADDEPGHPEEPGIVRADLRAAGWVLRSVDAAGTATHCTYFSMSDLRGNIPKRIVDIATRPQPMQIHNIHKFLAKDTSGNYVVDRERLRNGFTDADCMYYLNRMNRRVVPDVEKKYPWVREPSEEARGPSANGHKTHGNGTVRLSANGHGGKVVASADSQPPRSLSDIGLEGDWVVWAAGAIAALLVAMWWCGRA